MASFVDMVGWAPLGPPAMPGGLKKAQSGSENLFSDGDFLRDINSFELSLGMKVWCCHVFLWLRVNVHCMGKRSSSTDQVPTVIF